ncbi:Lipid A export ATP-binding/permease protein MsbA [Alloactinosynnema sp. L-07]|uniref:ABC transporter ATP-binding protein n=1 Tax=Alloactinosynnema sp. L-07 TaxID=1653480 RepID=UPI00065EF858|nr:ABC transporter ATP-binding protein [Alloactinosynnema sp. L-07]CRK61814.1 Lipid A export ATP-binding/permease protein MsbA [Alloactinosynnema sp. L-07]
MLLRVLKEYLARYRVWLWYVVALQLVGTMASLYLPSLNADIIDIGVARGDTGFIVRTGGWMLLVSLIQIACAVVAVFFGAKTAMGFGRDLRAGVFHRVGSFSSREVSRFGAPSLITRVTNDVQQIQLLVMMTTTMMVAAPIMMVGGVIMALREDVALSWLLVVSVPILFVGLGFIIRRMVPGFQLLQTRIDDVNRVLREQITGIRVVRAFVREPFETDRFGKANAELTEVSTRTGRYMAAMFPFILFVMNLSVIGVLWFGGHRVDDGLMEVGALTAYMNYVMQILMAVMMATFMLMMIPRAAVSAERIREVLDTESSVAPPTDPVTSVSARGEVDFDRVSFAYPGADDPVLCDVSFSARPGQTTAIIGSTGSGKTTLLNLVPRLFDATGGAVRVDGVDVRRLDQDLLWSKIGIVPQKTYLFTGTIASNLRYGKPDATDEELWAALTIAQARDFVSALADGLDAPIAQGGSNLSGGQRQRIAIARALVREPEIYLFDDSFSALDVATDARLRAALRPTTRDATVIIVAQRVSTVLDADQVVVLEDGRIVGLGTHAELLETCPTYQEIVASQLSAEEAA